MKKFIKSILTFFIPIILAGVLIEYALEKIPNDYKLKSQKLDSLANRIEILVLGNSHFYYGIDPAYFKEKAFNAAYLSQTLDYDYKLLEKYKNRFDSLKAIIIPIDYFSYYFQLGKSTDADRVKNYYLYYNIMMFKDLKLNNTTEIFNNTLRFNLTRLDDYYRKDKLTVFSNEWGWGTDYKSYQNQNLILTGETAAKRHKELSSSNEFYENLNTLRSIIKLAAEIKIEVILITSPGCQSYIKNLDNNQLYKTINTTQKLEKEFINVHYYNLLHDPILGDRDFYDADHLNERGAKIFSLQIDSLYKSVKSSYKF